eukprot:6288411-Amphidinium_carterae.1
MLGMTTLDGLADPKRGSIWTKRGYVKDTTPTMGGYVNNILLTMGLFLECKNKSLHHTQDFSPFGRSPPCVGGYVKEVLLTMVLCFDRKDESLHNTQDFSISR